MLATRLLTAALLIPPLVAALFIGGGVLGAVVLAITTLAAREVFGLLDGAGLGARPMLGTALAVALAAAIWLGGERPALLVAAFGAAFVLPAVSGGLPQAPPAGLRTWLATTWGAVYAGLMGFLLRITLDAPMLPASAPLAPWLDGGRGWLLVTVLLVWANDSGAYVAGKTLGRRPFAAHVSPKKTWEGTIGGMVAALAAGAALASLLGASVALGVLLGLVVALAAVVGDLAESVLKRAAGTKDSGTLIPGHGGMLDRVDSLLFAAPAAWSVLYTMRALGA